MGPGATTHAARCLRWIGGEVGDLASRDAVAAALARWRAQNAGPIAGFGVPFRAVDERRAAMVRFVGDGPIAQRRFWRLHQQLVECLAPMPPNCVISFAALLLDTGVAAERCSLAVTALMPHVFLAHALEASTEDGARLNAWPPDMVEYQGIGPRTTGDGQRGEVCKALRRIAP
jgi:hypothetical protein